MKKILNSLLFGCTISFSVNFNTYLAEGSTLNISEYIFGQQNSKVDERLVHDVCHKWVLARKMHYAGTEDNKGGWIGGCFKKNASSGVIEYETWESSANAICDIVAFMLTHPDYQPRIFNANAATPEFMNGFWIQKFVKTVCNEINQKHKNINTSLMKEQVLKTFYNDKDLKKDKDVFHDVLAYINTYDIFGMVIAGECIPKKLKALPQYEDSTRQKVTPIDFANDYDNCYLASFLQIINALDEDQIENPGLKRLYKLLREYNSDHLKGETPEDLLDKTISPKGLFNREYDEMSEAFFKVMEEVQKNTSLEKDPNVGGLFKKLVNFYKNEKKFIDAEAKIRTWKYSGFWHIVYFYGLKYNIEKDLLTNSESWGGKTLSQIINDELDDDTKKKVTELIKRTYSEKDQQFYIDMFENGNLFAQLYKLENDSKVLKKIASQDQVKVIQKFLKIRKLLNFIHSMSGAESLAECKGYIDDYFDIYTEGITEIADLYYRKNENENWQRITKDKFDTNDEICKKNSNIFSPTSDSKDILKEYLNKAKDISSSIVTEGLSSIDWLFDKMFDKRNADWMNGFTRKNILTEDNFKNHAISMIKKALKQDIDENQLQIVKSSVKKKTKGNVELTTLFSLKGKNLSATYDVDAYWNNDTVRKVKAHISAEVKKNIYRTCGIAPTTIINGAWLDNIKRGLMSKIEFKIDGQPFQYEITDQLLTDFLSRDNFRDLNDNYTKNGFFLEEFGKGKEKLAETTTRVRIKKIPKVLFFDYSVVDKKGIEYTNALTKDDYRYMIDWDGNLLIYRLVGFATNMPGHYDASVFLGHTAGLTDDYGWRTIDSFHKEKNYRGKCAESDAYPRTFQVYQQIYPNA